MSFFEVTDIVSLETKSTMVKERSRHMRLVLIRIFMEPRLYPDYSESS